MLPGRLGYRVPFSIGRGGAAFQAKLSEGVDADRRLFLLLLAALDGQGRLQTLDGFQRLLWKRFTHIRTSRTSIHCLIGIPVRTMAGTFAAFFAARLPAIAHLLVIGNFADHPISLNHTCGRDTPGLDTRARYIGPWTHGRDKSGPYDNIFGCMELKPHTLYTLN